MPRQTAMESKKKVGRICQSKVSNVNKDQLYGVFLEDENIYASSWCMGVH